MKKRKEIIEESTGDTVTIDELLKDEPEMLANLHELRKWMDENPDLFTFPEEKKTQGQKKLKQILGDARRNSNLAKGLEKLAASKPAYKIEDLQALYVVYRQYQIILRQFRKEFLSQDKSHQLRKALCLEYGIDPMLFDMLVSAYKGNRLEGWDFNDDTGGDMCAVEVQDEDEDPKDIHTFHLTELDQIDRSIYPVHLKLHRFASKRDVLDFIEKSWGQISPHLTEKRIKGRKLPREVLDLIWKHRDKKAKDIASIVSEKYPKYSLVYYEVSKLLSEEKKRRDGKKA
jgi:hypothetical protein